MQRKMLKSKIHRATITDCDLHYVGSITVDTDLLEQADILRETLLPDSARDPSMGEGWWDEWVARVEETARAAVER